MAPRANQRLAIDTENHLFFSNDEGRSWKAIPSPWKGRAVTVALTSAVSFASAAPALKVLIPQRPQAQYCPAPSQILPAL
jgi:hypothetical protein